MKPKEVKKFFGTFESFHLETGMSTMSLHNWIKVGYIPILSQIKLEKLTDGQLKASLDDYVKYKEHKVGKGIR